MRLLPGSFQTERFPTELEAIPHSALDRIPMRSVLALSVLAAFAVGVAAYLRNGTPKAQVQPAPVTTRPSEVSADAGPAQVAHMLPLDLQHDASEHAKAVERLLNQAVKDLNAAQISLEKVRPYASSEVDEAAERVQSARQRLDKAGPQLKVVETMITRK